MIFKEAFEHDFAPPIHSLDRHGDFAPPLTKFNEDAGFIESLDNPDGCAIRYNVLNGIPPRCNGWLSITTNAEGPFFGGYELNVTGAGRAGNMSMDAEGTATLTAGDDIQITALDNVFVDGVSLQVLAGSGGISLTSEAGLLLNGRGSEIVMSLYPAGTRVRITDNSRATLWEVDADSTSIHNLNTGKTYVINDGSGNPLVTYTG